MSADAVHPHRLGVETRDRILSAEDAEASHDLLLAVRGVREGRVAVGAVS